ncbi:MAG: NAD(P)/FAD-dependent oxidoreductase [Promethearchaeota archaeon]
MRYIIIGNGVAGVTAAQHLAENVSDEDIIQQFTDEGFPYYWKPQLPSFLGNDKITEKDVLAYSLDWYKSKKIDLHLNERVERLNLEEKLVITPSGEYDFDRLLLATGADCFVPPIEGRHLQHFYDLRTLNDAIIIRNQLKRSQSVVIIGGGVLGLEIANSCVQRGITVHTVEFFPYLLPRQLDPEGADVLQKILEKRGMKFYLGSQVEAILGTSNVEGVRLKNGMEIKADLVNVCTGIRSRKRLAEEAGISCNKGIQVNDYMETNVTNVYAAGDCAEHRDIVYGLIPPSTEQARIAATNILNPQSQKYTGSKFSATLKITDLYLTSLGNIKEEEIKDCIIKKYWNEEKEEYVKLFLSEDRILGAIILGTKRGIPVIRRIFLKNELVNTHREELNKLFEDLI